MRRETLRTLDPPRGFVNPSNTRKSPVDYEKQSLFHVATEEEFKAITIAFDEYYGISGECADKLNQVNHINRAQNRRDEVMLAAEKRRTLAGNSTAK